MAPGLLARGLGLRSDLASIPVALAGLVAGGAAWATIELLGVVPSATLWHGQPGGVRSEVAVALAAGAVVAILAVRVPRRSHER